MRAAHPLHWRKQGSNGKANLLSCNWRLHSNAYAQRSNKGCIYNINADKERYFHLLWACAAWLTWYMKLNSWHHLRSINFLSKCHITLLKMYYCECIKDLVKFFGPDQAGDQMNRFSFGVLRLEHTPFLCYIPPVPYKEAKTWMPSQLKILSESQANEWQTLCHSAREIYSPLF